MIPPKLDEYRIWDIKQNRFVPEYQKEEVIMNMTSSFYNEEYPSLLDETMGSMARKPIVLSGKEKWYYPVRDDYEVLGGFPLPSSMNIQWEKTVTRIFRVYDPIIINKRTGFRDNSLGAEPNFEGDVFSICSLKAAMTPEPYFYYLSYYGAHLQLKLIPTFEMMEQGFHIMGSAINLRPRYIIDQNTIHGLPDTHLGVKLKKVGTVFDKEFYGDALKRLALWNWNDMLDYWPNEH